VDGQPATATGSRPAAAEGDVEAMQPAEKRTKVEV
jgi:hypothetical protein